MIDGHDRHCEIIMRPHDAAPICRCQSRAELDRLRRELAEARGRIDEIDDVLRGFANYREAVICIAKIVGRTNAAMAEPKEPQP